MEELAPERSLAWTPLFQVLLVLQNAPLGAIELPDLELSPLVLRHSSTRFDLALSLTEKDAALEGLLEYDTELFDALNDRPPGRLARVAARGRGDPPERRLGDLELLEHPSGASSRSGAVRRPWRRRGRAYRHSSRYGRQRHPRGWRWSLARRA